MLFLFISGTILGITNGFGNLPGFIAPVVAGKIVNDDPGDVERWRNVWIITVVILAAESLFFLVFASGLAQEWNSNRGEKQGPFARAGMYIYQAGLIAIVVALFFATTEGPWSL